MTKYLLCVKDVVVAGMVVYKEGEQYAYETFRNEDGKKCYKVQGDYGTGIFRKKESIFKQSFVKEEKIEYDLGLFEGEEEYDEVEFDNEDTEEVEEIDLLLRAIDEFYNTLESSCLKVIENQKDHEINHTETTLKYIISLLTAQLQEYEFFEQEDIVELYEYIDEGFPELAFSHLVALLKDYAKKKAKSDYKA